MGRRRGHGIVTVRGFARWLARWELAGIALVAPLFLFPPPGRSSLLLILLVPAVWIVEAVGGVDPVPATPLNGALALMAVMVVVSLWATFDVEVSAPKVLGVVLGLTTFFALVRTLRSGRRTDLALDLFILGGTVLALIGLLGTNWTGKALLGASVTSRLPAVIRGMPGQTEGFQPNAVAGALVMFIPLQIACVATSRRRGGLAWRGFHLAALLIVSGTLVLTQSRSGWISLAVGLGAWAAWHTRRLRVILGIVVVALVLSAVSWSRLTPALSRGEVTAIREDTEGRLELWSRAVAGIEDFPITGMGMNTFRRIMPVLYPALLTAPDRDVAHAHNHLLQAALDLGVPGLIAYVALWFGAAGLLVAGIRRSADADERRLFGGLAAGMIAYFVFGTADTIALGAKVGIFFWIALALVVALHERHARDGTC